MTDIHGGGAKEICSKIEWKTTDVIHDRVFNRGAYFIYDRGYHPRKELIFSYKNQMNESVENQWSKHIESMKRDIECVFGLLKDFFSFFKESHFIAFPRGY